MKLHATLVYMQYLSNYELHKFYRERFTGNVGQLRAVVRHNIKWSS